MADCDRFLDRRRGPETEQQRMPGDLNGFVHQPVLAREVLAVLAPVPPGVVVDCTVGGGGHARMLLEHDRRRRLLGLDQDDHALVAAAEVLGEFGDRVQLRKARFDHLEDIVRREGLDSVSGVLFDLGVSSPQLDRPERGFSYRHDGPLDMRMDPQAELTAAEVVNSYDEDRLADILERHGDERFARRIARAIVAARPIDSTLALVEVVRAAIPAPARRRGGHPAKRTFQALRIEVNHELDVLDSALDQAIDLLVPRGRCAVLAYHSGEDRLVKERFRSAATGGCTCPPGLPCTCGARPTVRLLKRGAWRPSAEELATNPRAASARMRAVERLEPTGGAA
jgi:16S rRNA (cytosine1402-N4)-methyltransferase